ncbi:ribonuclease H-like domain-containing protein, partial [Tanacetum coccineum]
MTLMGSLPNTQAKSWKPCFNFAKGSCRFGNDCRYVHDPNAKIVNSGSSKQPSNNTTDALLLTLLEKLGVNDIGSSCTSNVNPSPVVTNAMPVAAYSVPGPGYFMAQSTSPMYPPTGFPSQPAQQQVQPIQSPIGPLMMAQPT